MRIRAAAMLWAVASAPIGAADLSVRFALPEPQAMVVGSTRIQLTVEVPPGTAIAAIDISVDGRRIATLTAPPWTIDWDAGEGDRVHRIDAALRTTDGREALATVRTTPLLVNEIERVDLVNLYVVVRDGRGDYVPDLGRQDFRVLENRREQVIDRFSQSHKPLRAALVLDVSQSMQGDKLDKAKQSALQFLEILEPEDEGLVVAFADEVEVVQPVTNDVRGLRAAIEQVEAGGGTALYDAIWRTARMLGDFDGRRVLVLLSDGQDQAQSGLEPGSLHTFEEAIDQALRSEVMVFPIVLGARPNRDHLRVWDTATGLSRLDLEVSLLDLLERLAGETGGRAVVAAAAGRLRSAFEEIAADLHNQYAIAYVSNDPKNDGKWRKIDVLTPGRDFEIITRKGYYAARETTE